MLKNFIPNFITLLNLLSGCIALVFISNDNILWSFYFVCIGIFFDYFDGFFARILNANSALGLQLDSLADMVTSGVVPGFATYQIMSNLTTNPLIPYLGFLITLGAAYRLAKFNISTNQSEEFIGLPVPANTLMVIGFLITININIDSINHNLPIPNAINIFSFNDQLIFLIVLSIFSCVIQNVNLKLFSLKMKTFNIKAYPFQFILVFITIVGLIFFQLNAIPFIILLYIILSLIKHFIYANQKKINA